MSYDKIPNFDDPYAKINERIHTKSQAKIVEVLYGAKNPDGTPKYPEKDANDGHGHFVALEIDGNYQMIMWRHPDSEGGYQEYGDYKEKSQMAGIYDNGADREQHPLKDLEDAIREKRRLLHEARQLMKTRDYDPEAVDRLLEEFTGIFDMNTPAERDLKGQHRELAERNQRRVREREQNIEQKRRLIEQAKELQNSEDWKKTSARMKELLEQWKTIGHAGPADKSLWEEFQGARQMFFDRQRRHYDRLDELRAQSKSRKQEIIREAGAVAQYSQDWKGTHEKLEEMLSRWKQAGSAGKEEDDRLWAEFQGIRNDFYARRKAAEKKREEEFLTRRQAKAALVAQAQSYASSCDYSAAGAERMKSMSVEWKEIGFCGKDYDDQLWSAFRMAQDTYWNGKKASGEERHRQWAEKTRDAIGRRRERISNIQRNIDNLRDRLNTTNNYDKQNQIMDWISQDETQIRELEEEIGRMEAELGRG